MLRTGTDIIEIARVKKALGSDHFLKRVFSEDEISHYQIKKDYRAENMAARFCAKEAFIKICGEALPFYEIGVERTKSGRPRYKLSGKAEKIYKELGIKYIDLSLSHCREYAVAFAVAECDDERKEKNAFD